MEVDYSRAGLVAATGIDPWSLGEQVRSGDPAALQAGALRARRVGEMAAEAVADGDRADRGLAAVFRNDGAAVFDAAGSTRRGAVLLADRGEKIEETARTVLDVATALSEAVASTGSRLSGLDAELNRIIGLRNGFVPTGPDAAAEAAAAEQRFFGLAVDAVRRTGGLVRSDLDAYEAVLDNRAARLAGLGYGVPQARPEDAAAVVVLPVPPVPPVVVLDVVLTILAILIAAITSSGGSDEPDTPVPGPPAANPPVHEKGALGDRYVPGVQDPDGLLLEKERTLAEWIAEHDPGSRVDPRPVDHTREGESDPDVIVRRGPDDPGEITELKRLDEPTNNAVKDRLLDGAHQVAQHGGGDVYIDGRAAGLTEEEAVRGYRRAAGVGDEMPRRTTILLGDGRALEFGG